MISHHEAQNLDVQTLFLLNPAPSGVLRPLQPILDADSVRQPVPRQLQHGLHRATRLPFGVVRTGRYMCAFVELTLSMVYKGHLYKGQLLMV